MPRLRYLALAAGVAIVLVAGGPLALQARLALGAAFPASFGTIVRGGIAAAVASRRRPSDFSHEDQFLAEAVWHVRRRNEAEGAGDLSTAWQENRIREAFFAPVLDTPSYGSASGFGFRWSPVQRENAALQIPSDAAPDRSRAEPDSLYLWPRTMFCAAIALLTATSGVICLPRGKGADHGGPADS